MKKNILTKLGGLFLGLTMGLGVAVGVTAGHKVREVKADDTTVVFGNLGSNMGTGSPATYTVDDITLTASNASGVDGSKVQLAKNATLTTSKIPGTITSLTINDCQTTSTKTDGGFVVYGSTDGSSFSEVEEITGLSSTAQNKTISFGTTNYSYLKIANGSARVLKTSQVSISYTQQAAASLVSISSVSASVSASSGDSAWTIASPVVTGVLSNSANVVDVSAYVDLSVLESVPAIKEDGTMNVTLVAKGKSDPKISKSAVVSAVLTSYNPIKDLYSKSENYSCDVYGVFVGNKDNNNIVIMYGEYGMDVYKNGCGTNTYVEGETVLHIVGPLALYNGLYEIKATSISTSTTESIPTPVVYVTQGGETSLYQSRLTNISGVPTVTKGSITGTAGSADVTLNFKVGTKDVQVFYKKANQTADGMSKMSTAVTNQEVITVTGFTSWYSGFQIQMTDIVEADASYTAEAFAQDLLSETDAVCAGYDGVTDNYNALLTVWNTLIDADHYQKVPQDQKNILVTTVANTSGTDVQKAMARYDYLVAKYGLSPFIDGRTVSPARVPGYINNQNDNTATIIIAVVSVLSLATLCTLIVIKRRKSIEK